MIETTLEDKVWKCINLHTKTVSAFKLGSVKDKGVELIREAAFSYSVSNRLALYEADD